jgi:hypothetical protein
MRNGKKHGKGKQKWERGAWDGEWIRSTNPGGGWIVNWVDENEYDGEWKEGKMHGHGVYTFKGEAPKLGYWHEGTVMKWL